MPKLKLSVKAIRELQTKHGIKNLLNPGTEDAAKLANLDFLVDIYFEGSRKFESAPAREDIEELDFADLLKAVQSFLKGESEGNG